MFSLRSGTTDEAEIIPGTKVLLQTNDGLRSSSEPTLVPEPSNSPDDPLNWSPRWKAIVLISQVIFVFISILTPLAIAPLTPIFIQEFHTTLPKVNMLFGAAAIALGYANFIVLPFSNVFGRRLTMLICGMIRVLANIWQARVTSYNSFIAARVISGLGAAANESIMPMVIVDIMFLHQRGLWKGLYLWAYFIGVFIGPIIAGNIGAHVSWRWFFWACTIAQGVNLIMLVFMMPETRYIRNTPQIMDNNITSSPNLNFNGKDGALSPTTTTVPGQEKRPMAGQQNQVPDHTPLAPRIVGKPSRAQFSLIPRPQFDTKNVILRDIVAPIQIFTFPIIFWVAFAFGFATNCLLALNLTQSQVFAAPPYLFNPAQVGFVNFAFVVGGIIGLLTAGPFSDWVSMRVTKKNGGVREAEMRLVALVPYIIIYLIGMVVTALGYQRHWPWQVVVVIGCGLVGIEVVAIPAIIIAYAVDCYKHLPGQIMVCATIVKNTWGFGMIFYYNDWAVIQGFIPPVLTWMVLAVGTTTIGMVVFKIWGKSFRRATMHSKLHQFN